MNVGVLKAAGIDYEHGVKRFMGRAHLFEKTLAKFPKDTTFKRIEAAHDADDDEQLLASAHEFKGMCGNIALTSLADISAELVALLRLDKTDAQEKATAFARLESEYHIVVEAINAAMEE